MRRIYKVLICSLLIVGYIWIGNSFTKERSNKELQGQEATIGWEELNIRENAGTDKEIITTIMRGQKVILTGKEKDSSFGGNESDHWVQIKWTDHEKEITGWVISKGLIRAS